MKNQLLYISAIILMLYGCKIKPPTTAKNNIKMPDAYSIENDTIQLDTIALDTIQFENYIVDETLMGLIDTAIQNNYDLKIALQRIEMAKAQMTAAKGAYLPKVDAGVDVGVTRFGKYTMDGVGNFDTNLSTNINEDQKIPDPTPDFFLGVQSSWEADIWKKLKARKKAAYLNFMATKKGKKVIITALVSQIAHLYYEMLELDAELVIIQKNIELQKTAVELVNIQKIAGRVTELAVQQFKAQLLNSRSLEHAVRQEILTTENAINALLGRFPQPIPRGTSLLEHDIPKSVKVGIPANLLLNRPDIQQAELELQASEANLFAARAAFYPSLVLTSYLGYHAFKPQLVFETPSSIAFNIAGGLTAPIFNRNGIKADFSRARAKNMELLYKYQQNIFTAYKEVITALQGIENYEKVYNLKQEQVDQLRQAVSTSNELFMVGFASYLEVVTAQKNVFEAELEMIRARRNQFSYLIDIYRSIGGGWKE